ncbi:hypothetical protein [Nonomuraea typhae]|uniref:Secreted protein n=1 Tax=Nonomuraea typhae TaxID=2603600 RepID=A0ABW7Z7E1_9ACTN
MNRITRHLATIAVAGIVTATGLAATTSTAANADARCTWGIIKINTGRGAEPPRWARGHKHRTGNHYLKRIRPGGWLEWWADNNGGRDGDTRDTFHRMIRC